MVSIAATSARPRAMTMLRTRYVMRFPCVAGLADERDRTDAEVGLAGISLRALDAVGDVAGEPAGDRAGASAAVDARLEVEADPADDQVLRVRAGARQRVVHGEEELL